MFSKSIFTLATALLSCRPSSAQTYSACNPLYTTGCPAKTALGKSISIDFTRGGVDTFTPTGGVTYDSQGVHFTVTGTGDAPQLTSVFYIMFGKVEIRMKAAPGAGIVSSVVLQSDTLDEIDMEWLGADNSEVQTNYFGKGDVTSYNRGAFNPAPNNQAEFITYTMDWTQKQITWSVGGKVVRVLTPETADRNQYPQTPMQVKFGSWSGGDPSNPPGTINWARGPTDYSKGPFTMTVQSLAVTDYSTGTQYKYGDTSGNWPSIVAVGGKVNGNSGAAGSPIASAQVPAVTSASPSIPAGLGQDSGNTATRTGWPWVQTATRSATKPVWTTAAGLPEGWVISSEGKIVPASTAATLPASTLSSLQGQQSSQSLPPSPTGLETVTGWDDRGFPITRTLRSGWQTASKIYDDQGFLITATPTGAAALGVSTGVCFGANCGDAGKVVGTATSKAGVAPMGTQWRGGAFLGLMAVFAERFLI